MTEACCHFNCIVNVDFFIAYWYYTFTMHLMTKVIRM